ncbi:MAG: phosphatidylglycerophosphatase A [Ignavibacteriaceae bacterium]|nr:phosphatidylglycerophosphatase A [Ignavibacteriaceae bacterium]
MKLDFFSKIYGSGIYTGFIPFASGTFGSIVATGIFLIPGFTNYYIILPAILVSTLVGIPMGDRFEKVYGKDPSEFTLDEFVGTWISYLFLPLNVYWITAAFILWRILDIIKPFPAGKLENIPGGMGIMIDDIVSGLYTCLVMNLIYRLI